MASTIIYHPDTYNSHNIDYYLIDAQEKRQTETLIHDILDLYEVEFDLDDILVSTRKYLTLYGVTIINQ